MGKGTDSVEDTLHIYTRVSTVAQAEQGTSLETQRELGTKKARELGFKVKLWDEGGKSSHHEDIADRPVLSELFNALKVGKVKHLWVYDQSRLSRNDQVASIFRYQCDKQGVTLYTKDGAYDLSNPTDKLAKQLLDAVAEFDNASRAERTRIGKLNKVRKGSWHGGPAPFGYELRDHKLVVKKDEARWVKRIFSEVIKGSSIIQIKHLLDTNGVEPRRKKSLWSIGSIAALLKNTHYAGYYIYIDRKSGERLEVQCPSILDITTWKAAQHKRSTDAARSSQRNATVRHFYLLRDLMFCGHCGRALSGRINKDRAEGSYYCAHKERQWVVKGGSSEKWKRGAGCGFSRAMNIKQADSLVWQTVTSLHQQSSLLREEVKQRTLKQAGVIVRSDSEVKALQSKMRRLQKEHQRLGDGLGTLEANRVIRGLSDASFVTASERIKDEIGKIEEELASLRIDLEGPSQSRRWVDWLKSFGDEIKKLDALTDQQKKDYLTGLVKRIDVSYKEQQRQHTLKLTLHLPIVDDGIRYTGKGNSRKEYELVNGKDKISVVAKKKDGRG